MQTMGTPPGEKSFLQIFRAGDDDFHAIISHSKLYGRPRLIHRVAMGDDFVQDSAADSDGGPAGWVHRP